MKLRIMPLLALTIGLLVSCGGEKKKDAATKSETKKAKTEVAETDPLKNKGIGPVKHIELGAIDEALVAEGKELFRINCKACHRIDKRRIGPALKGLTERRTPEWIMNMILNPDEMVQKDPIAKKLLMEYSAPMSNQSLKESEARALLEYFRTQI